MTYIMMWYFVDLVIICYFQLNMYMTMIIIIMMMTIRSSSNLKQGANYKKILRLSYDVIITYDNRKSNL